MDVGYPAALRSFEYEIKASKIYNSLPENSRLFRYFFPFSDTFAGSRPRRNHEFLHPAQSFPGSRCANVSPEAFRTFAKYFNSPSDNSNAYQRLEFFPFKRIVAAIRHDPRSLAVSCIFQLTREPGILARSPPTEELFHWKSSRLSFLPSFAARPLESRAFHFRLLPLCPFHRLLSLSLSFLLRPLSTLPLILFSFFEFPSVRRDENHQILVKFIPDFSSSD